MKNRLSKSVVLVMAIMFAGAMMILSLGCNKDSDDSNNSSGGTGGSCWGENWLIGTWEGTTPSSVTPFANTKIRIVFENAVLKIHDSAAGNPRKLWAYDGTLTWDAGGSGEWNMRFYASNFPVPDYGVIIYECVMMTAANQGMANVSIRVNDTTQTNPHHSVDLDWGPYIVTSPNPVTSFKLYGDVELDFEGNVQRADYLPNESDIIMTKK